MTREPTMLRAALGGIMPTVGRSLDGGAPFLRDGELRAAIAQLCDAARRDGLTIEQLLVEFKNACRALPELARLSLGGERSKCMARLVTLCIEEFYAPSGRQVRLDPPPSSSQALAEPTP